MEISSNNAISMLYGRWTDFERWLTDHADETTLAETTDSKTSSSNSVQGLSNAKITIHDHKMVTLGITSSAQIRTAETTSKTRSFHRSGRGNFPRKESRWKVAAILATLAAIFTGNRKMAQIWCTGQVDQETSEKSPNTQQTVDRRGITSRRPPDRGNVQARRDLPDRRRDNSERVLPRGQEGHSQAETDSELEADKRIRRENSLQDVNDGGREESDEDRSLDGKDRSQGLLSPSTSRGKRPEIHSDTMEGKNVPFSMSTFWSHVRAHDSYQTIQANNRTPTQEGNKVHDIYRRYANSSRNKRRVHEANKRNSVTIKVPGSGGKSRKISINTSPGDGVLGYAVQHETNEYIGTQEEGKEFTYRTPEIHQQGKSYSATHSLSSGQDQRHGRRHIPYESPHYRPVHSQEPDPPTNRVLEFSPSHHIRSQEGRSMVARERKHDEWAVSTAAEDRSQSWYRRQQSQLGSMARTPNWYPESGSGRDIRTLQFGGEGEPYQLQGATSSSEADSVFSKYAHQQSVKSWNRQLHNNVLYEPSRWQGSRPFIVGGEDFHGVQTFEPSNFLSLRSRTRKCTSRLSVKVGAQPLGLSPQQKCVPEAGQAMGAPHHRPLCIRGERSPNSIRQLEGESECDVGRLNGPHLGQRKRLGQSSFLNDQKNNRESEKGASHDHNGGTSVGGTDLVSTNLQHHHRHPNSSSRPGRSVSEASPVQDKPCESKMGDDRCQDLRKALLAEGVSKKVIDQLISKWEEGTNKAYRKPWERWCTFSAERDAGPFDPTINDVREYVQRLIDDGHGQSSVEKHFYILSGALKLVDSCPLDITSDEICQNLLESVAKHNPTLPKLTYVFDITHVFVYWYGKVNSRLSITQLRVKLIHLLRAFTGWREADCSGVFWDLSFLSVGDKKVKVRAWNCKSHKNKWCPYAELERLEESLDTLCPLRVIDEYKERTSSFPRQQVALPDNNGKKRDVPLLVKNKPDPETKLHMPYRVNTFASDCKVRGLDVIMDDDGQPLGEKFTPHTFRHAVASFLAEQSVSDERIAQQLHVSVEVLNNTYKVPVETKFNLEPCKDGDSIPNLLLSGFRQWLAAQEVSDDE